jgi:hypothetical protein
MYQSILSDCVRARYGKSRIGPPGAVGNVLHAPGPGALRAEIVTCGLPLDPGN